LRDGCTLETSCVDGQNFQNFNIFEHGRRLTCGVEWSCDWKDELETNRRKPKSLITYDAHI